MIDMENLLSTKSRKSRKTSMYFKSPMRSPMRSPMKSPMKSRNIDISTPINLDALLDPSVISGVTTPTRSYCPTPDLVYERKSGLKSPLIEPVGRISKFIPNYKSKPVQAKCNSESPFKEMYSKGKSQKMTEDKIEHFKQRLSSKLPEDVIANAEILVEILKSFSFSFNVDMEDILAIMGEEKGQINLQSLRNKLFERYN